MTNQRDNNRASEAHSFAARRPGRWDWLPEQMPGVARQMAERRAELGAKHVAECWRRGVLEKQPGWFFAREGALAVGTPWSDPALVNFAAANVTATQSLLMLREPDQPCA